LTDPGRAGCPPHSEAQPHQANIMEREDNHMKHTIKVLAALALMLALLLSLAATAEELEVARDDGASQDTSTEVFEALDEIAEMPEEIGECAFAAVKGLIEASPDRSVMATKVPTTIPWLKNYYAKGSLGTWLTERFEEIMSRVLYPRTRLILRGYYALGMTDEAIAEELNMSTRHVNSQRNQFIRSLEDPKAA